MSDSVNTFESTLAVLFESYAARAPVEVDARTLAATIAKRDRRIIELLGRTYVKPRWLVPALATLMLLLALAAVVFVGAQLLRDRTPRYPPLRIQPAGFMSQQRGGAVAAMLSDGRVLVIGGTNSYVGANASYAEIYDPVTRTFEPTGSTAPVGVQGHAATVLPDGRVLITGGYGAENQRTSTALLYDPASASFDTLAGMMAARANHASVLLADGRVALIGGVAGGTSESGSGPAVEYFDPPSLAFSADADMPELRVPSPVAFTLSSTRIIALARGSPLDPLVFDTAAHDVEHAASSFVSEARVVVFGAAQVPDGRVTVALNDRVSPSDIHGALLHLDGAGADVGKRVELPGPVELGPVALADGRVLIGVPDSSDCTSVVAFVYSAFDDSLTRLGQIGGIGACSELPSSTITALADGGALIAGGYMSYGGETSAVSLIHP